MMSEAVPYAVASSDALWVILERLGRGLAGQGDRISGLVRAVCNTGGRRTE